MAIHANRVRSRNYLPELLRFFSAALKRFLIIAMLFFCAWQLYFPAPAFSRACLEITGTLLSAGSAIADPIIDNIKLLFDRLSYLRNLEIENSQLKLQLANMVDMEIAATNIQAENKELRKLLNVVDAADYDHITSRLIGASMTPLSSSAIIEAGNNHNIKINSLVTTRDGLLGRITDVSDNYSSVMLLNDPNSRVPVVTSSSRERGMLTKQGDEMALGYLPENHNIQPGELVYTSGDGKIYPHGLLVGKVSRVDTKGVFITLAVNLNNTEFVIIESKAQDD